MITTTHSNLSGSGLREVSGDELARVEGGVWDKILAAICAADQATGGAVFKTVDQTIKEYKESKGGKK